MAELNELKGIFKTDVQVVLYPLSSHSYCFNLLEILETIWHNYNSLQDYKYYILDVIIWLKLNPNEVESEICWLGTITSIILYF